MSAVVWLSLAPVVGCPTGLEEGEREEDGLTPALSAPKPLTPLADSRGRALPRHNIGRVV